MKTFDDNVFIEGLNYSIGTNDGVSFEKITYICRKNNAGKQVLCFTVSQGQKTLVVNPSYMSWAIEDGGDIKWAD
jgi:hypothetical protein